ncbi:GNAT family N-acetyltransferase [Saccharopolyspora elongata]|uniref:N-acetyltransferase n=1 Tax=Saccharopolyspora elongata TaxID=2530387 RepID=A0A4V6PDL8_9PSEU|nr:GNAT family protein [Saccharopolyspora elongata]TDD38807.1 N-acetyltransferase [Saccharopolyspora elongata]
MLVNELSQPVGQPVPGWTPRPVPTTPVLKGRYCQLERLDPHRHAEELFDADQLDTRGESWTYLPYGPFTTLTDYRQWGQQVHGDDDPIFYAIIATDQQDLADGHPRAVGVLSFLRIQPEIGVIEIGHVHYSPLLQRRRAATEAQYLLASHVFDELGYRRLEWKCDALNAASRAAAQRLGYSYEGTFRQATMVKGRNRDTSWYSIIDSDWPNIRDRFTTWLQPDNFDSHGHQRTPLRPT